MVDGALLFASSYLAMQITNRSRTAALALHAPLYLLNVAYVVHFHRRWGQTVGKMAAGVILPLLDRR